jgi:hypothetical protein
MILKKHRHVKAIAILLCVAFCHTWGSDGPPDPLSEPCIEVKFDEYGRWYIVHLPCCGGEVYDPLASCCIDGTIVPRDPDCLAACAREKDTNEKLAAATLAGALAMAIASECAPCVAIAYATYLAAMHIIADAYKACCEACKCT